MIFSNLGSVYLIRGVVFIKRQEEAVGQAKIPHMGMHMPLVGLPRRQAVTKRRKGYGIVANVSKDYGRPPEVLTRRYHVPIKRQIESPKFSIGR